MIRNCPGTIRTVNCVLSALRVAGCTHVTRDVTHADQALVCVPGFHFAINIK